MVEEIYAELLLALPVINVDFSAAAVEVAVVRLLRVDPLVPLTIFTFGPGGCGTFTLPKDMCGHLHAHAQSWDGAAAALMATLDAGGSDVWNDLV